MTVLDDQIRQQFAVEQFYYREAALLDGRQYNDWLDLFTDDVLYWMPIRRTKMSDELDTEFTPYGASAHFDDDKEMLTIRIRKLETGYAWSEDPPSRTRHLISNVRITGGDRAELTVESNFHLYRSRMNWDEDSWFGLRRDILRRDGDSFMIAKRSIFLEQTVILSQNLSNFF